MNIFVSFSSSLTYTHIHTHTHTHTHTHRYCCKPKHMQELLYNAYYGGWGFKYQGVMLPNGLMGDLWGPLTGRHHDIYLWTTSGLGPILDGLPPHPGGSKYYLYGDPAYRSESSVDNIITGYSHLDHLTQEQKDFNKSLNAMRVSNEWGFRMNVQHFSAVNFLELEKFGISPLGARYYSAVILHNIRTCVNGFNQTSIYFQCPPPSLAEFLAHPAPANRRPFAAFNHWGRRQNTDLEED